MSEDYSQAIIKGLELYLSFKRQIESIPSVWSVGVYLSFMNFII